MATRSKTIEFCSTVDTSSLTAATNRDKTIAIYIPESSPTFRSAVLQCYFRTDVGTGNAGSIVLTIGTDGTFATSSASTGAQPGTQSGEFETFMVQWDFASFFTSNWSGTSNTWSVRINIPTIATANHSFKLLITYEYDDTSSTHVKTVRIPIESKSGTGLQAATWATLGGATAIPAVEGAYLPEASVTVRQAFLELMGDEASVSTTDFTLQGRINGAGSTDIWRAEQSANTTCFVYLCWDITGEDLSSARSLELQSTLANRFDHMGGWLTVTYEFSPGSSSTIYNSLLLGIPEELSPGQLPGTTTSDVASAALNIYIEEPTTITLKESGVMFSIPGNGSPAFLVAVGAQSSYTTYTLGSGTVQAGPWSVMHRIDSGGNNGVAYATPARGLNTVEVRCYTTSSGEPIGVSGFIILNYTSGKATAGVGAHNQSRYFGNFNVVTADGERYVASQSCPIVETSYWINDVAASLWLAPIAAGAVTSYGNHWGGISAERASGEGTEEGYRPVMLQMISSDPEDWTGLLMRSCSSVWNRHPLDTDSNRLDIETSRSFLLESRTDSFKSGGFWVTYHAITFTVSGTISGSGGGTVNLVLHRASDNQPMATGSRVGNGSYSFTWYDNVADVYVTGFEDSTHTGRSDDAPAS